MRLVSQNWPLLIISKDSRITESRYHSNSGECIMRVLYGKLLYYCR